MSPDSRWEEPTRCISKPQGALAQRGRFCPLARAWAGTGRQSLAATLSCNTAAMSLSAAHGLITLGTSTLLGSSLRCIWIASTFRSNHN